MLAYAISLRGLGLASRWRSIAVDKLAVLRHRDSIEKDRAGAHRHVEMTARVARSACVSIRAGREHEVARKGTRVVAVGLGPVHQHKRAPLGARIETPTQV